jgi:hypothetical protein
MSRLAEIQDRIQGTGMAINRAEQALAAHPDIPSAAATLRGFLKMRENLEAEFLQEANALEMDACGYRVFPEGSRATISGLTIVLNEFQRLFTIVYDAIVSGPKQIAKWSDNAAKATALGFAYTYPGSIGIMMTLPSKRLLFGETENKLDEAMRGVFDIMSVTSDDSLNLASQKFGIAAIRVAHQWAQANAEAKYGADIVWLRKDDVKSRIRLQEPEIARLATVIGEANAITIEDQAAEITMIDWDNKSFRLKSDGKVIAGSFEENAVDTLRPANVPGFYVVKLRVSRRLLSDGDSGASYVLLDLQPPVS